ncbi:PilC/PilY family type IV pilus protein [Acinetobacter towneri]|uniref:PilC/PilY family type IV pilus protein n=1 Tax=Acinetobacter towneri TaxID=202956 RepID=UPI00293697D4|nr:PilC/PilY family type IV pilus protein [Acinetobacter towneri]MDV2483744.1 PilC/PilY family type IV pilus protein [Acinetobacter towneri]
MKKIAKPMMKKSYRPNLLATSIAAVCTVMIASSVTQASDIDIYQQAKSGDITLMMMLDISTSMNGAGTARTDFGLSSSDCSSDSDANTSPNYGYKRKYCVVTKANFTTLSNGNATAKEKAAKIETGCNIQSNGDYHCGDRTARMKDAMYELLNGSTTKGIVKVGDHIIIGLSTFGVKTNSDYAEGAILVPARALSAVYNGKTQRQILTEKVQDIQAKTYTPTAYGYAEVINYLMGKRPSTTDSSNHTRGFNNSDATTKTGTGNSTRYESPASLTSQTTDTAKCSGQGIYVLTDGVPNSKHSLTQTNMQTGLYNTFSCNTNNNWDCQHKAARALLDKQNPLNLEVRTAVIGFGDVFETLSASTKYDKKLGQTQNIANLGGCTSTGCTGDAKQAAYWGIVGDGGWYAGSSSQSVVDSVNKFLGDLGTEIPAVTTGSPAIPRDALNPSTLQNDAYYPQFQPTPDKAAQLWLGNLKKYLVSSTGALKDKNSNNIIDSKGRIIDNYDYWSPAVDASVKDADENTYGSIKYALRGGAWSQLKLRTATDGTIQRKLLTNRVYKSGSGVSSVFGDGTSLRTVNLDYLTDNNYKNDPNRGYLISLLGYSVDAANPASITSTSLTSASELRQIGAVMHSTPVLVTNQGKISYDTTNKKITSTNRKDFVLFGTTQGLLHVVDAETGQEKFAFVPNEMVERQKEAFLTSTATSGGMNNLFYGVDGAWTLHTEYVLDDSGNLTVGERTSSSIKGKQLAVGGLRMGGRGYYGLDLSNIDSPALKFNINPTDASTSCSNSNPLACMGQSWSKPNLGYVNWGGKRTLVMFVGGGYDAGYESDTYNQTDSKKGAGVFMFRVEDETGGGTGKAGDLLWWANANATNGLTGNRVGTNDANLKYSVVSEIRTVDRDGDDLIDHLYFGDLGGQLFRIDLNNKAATIGDFAKRVQRIIDLNTAAAVDKRPRFYDMPAFSLYSENGSTFAVVSIGSGNRSSPLKDYATGTTGYDHDAIYNVYDKDVARKDLYNTLPTTGATALKTSSVTKAEMGEVTNSNRNSQTTLVAPYSGKGWYYKFQSSKLQSEKVFGTPLALNYQLYASTFDGSKDGISGDCGAGVKGESFLNRFCMPYGQCKTENAGSNAANCVGTKCDKISLGAGIHTAVVRGDDTPPTTPNPNDPKVKNDGTSAGNYCLSTGGRTAYTPLGGGSGEQTQICLIPQRWYERLQ